MDAFRATTQPGYASGVYAASEGFSGGGLKVTLGGLNNTTVLGMSGGWRRTFSMSSATAVLLSFRYRLTQTAPYESDEFSDVVVRVDAMQPGTGGTDYVARIAGDGDGGIPRTTGWQLFEVDLGTLAAGTHTLTIGGYNNKKTFGDEVTDVLLDDVRVGAAAPPAPPVLTSIAITPALATVAPGASEQFTAQGYDQYGTAMATTVTWSANGGGDIDTAGLFTASNVGGPFTITAQSGSISGAASVTVAPSSAITPEVSGEMKQWHAVTLTFTGPSTSETASPNPFTDYRLNATFTGPSGQIYIVPGYYAADGNAGNTGATSGDKWRVIFAPDAVGTWTYAASFVQGTGIAAQPTEGGTSAGYFDGVTGSFSIAASDKSGRDFRGKGKLEYVNDHYLRFRNGEYFLKAGSNLPETFLEYNDFDGTPANLDFSTHVADWVTGDPTWQGTKGKGVIGGLNYLSSLGINALFFVTMNNYGDGQKAWPWTGKDNYYTYDVSKLDQWDIVFTHMDRKGLMLHMVLTETKNELYFEVAELGTTSGFANSRKIYYRELVARFGYHLGITWNLGEESGWNDAGGYATGSSTQQRKDWADYLDSLTYYADLISVHNGPSTTDNIYAPLLGHASLTGVEIQWIQGSAIHSKVLEWRNNSNTGHRWVVSLVEPWAASNYSVNDFRTIDVWPAYLAGAGGVEYFFNGDLAADDFRVHQSYFQVLTRARAFLQTHTTVQSLVPADGLVSGVTGYALAQAGNTYVVYLPSGGIASLDLRGVSGTFDVRWFDPRNGGSLQTGTVSSVTGGGVRSLGQPPNSQTSDWTVLVKVP